METGTMIFDWMAALLRWLTRRLGGLMLIYISLLILSLGSMAVGLASLIHDISARSALLTVLCGALLAWQLARSRLKTGWAALMGLLAGVPVLLLTTGGLAAPLWTLTIAAGGAVLAFLRRQTPDPAALAGAWDALASRLTLLWERLLNWSRLVGGEVVATDPLAVGLFWGAALWLIALWAAWLTRRREAVLLGLLPGAVLLVFNVYYTNSRAGLAWVLLLGASILALQAIQTFAAARRRWQADRLDQAEVEPSLAAAVFGLTLGLVVFSALLPSISIPKLVERVDEFFTRRDDRLAESLGLQQTPEAGQGGAGSFISGSHIIGPGPRLSREVVMYVSVEGYEPVPETARLHGEVPEEPIRYYWRSQTFDLYNGRGWNVATGRPQELPASQPIYPDLAPQPDLYVPITQHVQRLNRGTAVLATGELLALDQPARLAWHAPGDLASAESGAEQYTALSRVAVVSVERLQAAGSDYPAEIRDRYLQLPDNLPARVRDLAFEITAGQPTPYDQAAAIEAYLRRFPYNLDVPAPPLGRDAVDFFLFDLQEGYCDYYAASMVVLARSVGIPARLVIGYSRGFYEEGNRRFVVRENHAHAWVEVYFPHIGWIEFEPTSNQPRIVRPRDLPLVSAAELAAASHQAQEQDAAQRQTAFPIPRPWLWGGLVVLLLALLLSLDGWLLLMQPGASGLRAIYRRLYRLGQRWSLPGAGALTPGEFAAALSARLETFAGTPRLLALSAAVRRDLAWLTALYVRSLYAERHPSRQESRQAVRVWSRLRWRLWLARWTIWRRA
ncbi:MAG: transglutaminase domain-containing protein [Anaerolineales bacterium]